METCGMERCPNWNEDYNNHCKTFEHIEACMDRTKNLIAKEAAMSSPFSEVLCTLRPNGEPHPAMKSIYDYVDEIEDKEPERADSICSLAMQLEEKLWKMAVGA